MSFLTNFSRSLAIVGIAAMASTACSDSTSPVAKTDAPGATAAKGGPKALPSNGRIYFTSDVVGDYEVYSMLPDGSDRRRLTYTAESEFYVAVSRDGKKLAVVTRFFSPLRYELHTMNTDGSQRRFVTVVNEQQMSRPTWSPDGRSLAFSYQPTASDPSGIWSVSTNGQNLTRLTADDVSAADAAWSPDGKRIAHVRRVPNSPNEINLYVMNADGSDAEMLLECGLLVCRRPVWSPDGTHLYYTRTSALGTRVFYCALWLSTPVCEVPLQHEVQTERMAVAPDGSQLAFRGASASGHGIFTADANGAAQSAVTGSINVFDLSWGR